MKSLTNKLVKKEEKSYAETWFASSQDSFNFKDQIAPSYVKEELDYMMFGDNYLKTFVIINYPTKRVGNWLSELYRFKGNLTVSYQLVPAPAHKLRKSLNGSIDELKVRLSKPLKADIEMETEKQLEGAITLMKKLSAGESNNIFNLHMYLHLTTKSREELERLSDNLEQKCFDVGLTPHVPKRNMLPAFNSVVPVNQLTIPQYTARNVDPEAAASFFPFDESEIFMESGILKGTNKTTGSPVIVNQYALPSHNEFVLGMTGTGKTFYMLKDLIRHYMQGFKVFAIDPERNFAPVVEKLGGQVISISYSGETIVNPLEIKSFETEEKDKNNHLLNRNMERLQIFFKLIKTDLTVLESALIERYLIQTYKDKGITFDSDFSHLKPSDYPILTDFFNTIDTEEHPELKNFKEILRIYVEGSNSKMFNGHTNVDLHSDLICFDLSQFEEGSLAQQAAMYNILSFIWDEITKDKVRLSRLYVDEAHIMANPDNPRAMKFLYNVYKRIRNYKGGATIGTQQLEDFLSAIEGHRNYGKAMISNSISQLILGLKPESIDFIEENKVLSLSEEEQEVLIRAYTDTEKRGEGIYVVGNQRVHIQVDYTPEEMQLIDPVKYHAEYGTRGA